MTLRNPGEREKRLKQAAAEVIAEWEKYKKIIAQVCDIDAICESTEFKWLDVINSFFLGGGTALGLGVGAGLGIALVSYAGVKVWRKYKERTDSPYGYLNKIAALQATNHTLLSLPPAF